MRIEIQSEIVLPRLEEAKKNLDHQIDTAKGIKFKPILAMIETSALLFAVIAYIKDCVELKEQEDIDIHKVLRKDKDE